MSFEMDFHFHRLSALVLALGLAALPACGDDDGGDGGGDPDAGMDAGMGGLPANAAAAVATYGEIVRASYEDSLAAAGEMDTALQALVDDPSATTLEAAQQAWLDARVPYLQTEVYRFYDGPIDGDEGDPEGLINAWPMDEMTVDYVDGMPEAGRINDMTFDITTEALAGANGEAGEADVAAGWHPIEFLLWGQDLTPPADLMPGQRSFEDYSTADNADRRGDYLMTASDLLQENLQFLVDSWAATGNTYRTQQEDADPAVGLTRILTGLIVLAGFETAGERLQAALDEGDQEEEHSCFADNTHNDMLYDVIGIQNVWTGTYARTDGTTTVSGTSISDVVREVDSALAASIDTQVGVAVTAAMGLQAPFDNEILPTNADGNARVQTLIDELRELESLFTDVFVEFGFTVPPDAL
ncbi:MAG: imelysin family protein [Myxococcota bacterium]